MADFDLPAQIAAIEVANQSGSGSPEGSVTAVVGTRYVDTDNGNAYTKTSGTGSTGWSTLAVQQNYDTLTTETLASNVDDWNPTDLARGTLVVIPDGAGATQNIDGIVAQTNGFVLTIANVGTGDTLRFRAERTSSSAANRLAGSNVSMAPGTVAQFIYSTDLSRWIGFA